MPLENKGIQVGQLGPDWELQTVQGEKFTFRQFRGQNLLLFFFRGTWCPSCRGQMEMIRDNWGTIQGFAQVIGIVGENPRQTKEFLDRNPLPFPLLADPTRKVIEDHNIYKQFSLDGFRIARPTTIIYDRHGIVRYCYVGSSQFDRPSITELLTELAKVPIARTIGTGLG